MDKLDDLHSDQTIYVFLLLFFFCCFFCLFVCLFNHMEAECKGCDPIKYIRELKNSVIQSDPHHAPNTKGKDRQI